MSLPKIFLDAQTAIVEDGVAKLVFNVNVITPEGVMGGPVYVTYTGSETAPAIKQSAVSQALIIGANAGYPGMVANDVIMCDIVKG